MKTKPTTFDAVASSRRWREDAGRMLDAMGMGERVAFLESLRDRSAGKAPWSGKLPKPDAVVREDEAPYPPKPGGKPRP